MSVKVFEIVDTFVLNFFDAHDVDGEIIDGWNVESKDLLKAVKEAIEKIVKDVANESKTKKNKKPKDAPKNAKSAYMFFVADHREQVKKEHPELTAKEITSKLGEIWKADYKEKDVAVKYQDQADADKDRYKKEIAAYVPSGEPEEKKKRAKKPKDAPKNAKSAYMFFCADRREQVKKEHPEFDAKEVTTELGKIWKADFKEKDAAKKYQDQADEDKDRYKKDMETYVPGESSESESEGKKDSKDKKPRAKKPKDAPKNAKSAYQFFTTDHRVIVKKEKPELDSKEITKELSDLWKKIKDTDDAKEYNDKATADKERYKKEMSNYTPSSTPEKEEKKSSGEKEKKKRTMKPKDAPKNAKSAYTFYCADKRSSVKEENSNMNAKDVNAELSKLWKQVKETDEAKKYNDMASADKERYKSEMENYTPPKTVDTDEDTENEEFKEDESENEKVVRKIIDECDEDSITMKYIKNKLKEMEVVIEKDELKQIIAKINDA